VLALASSQGRILVSHDTSTMPVHFAEFLTAHGDSPGVLLIRQNVSCGQMVEVLLMIWSASNSEEWANQIHYLPGLTRHIFRE
jgi:hypothetical protein